MSYDYSNYGAFKDSVQRPTPSTRAARLAKSVGLKNPLLRFTMGAPRYEPVLEIGCGNGKFMRDLLIDGFKDVRGIEPSRTYSPLVDPRLITHEMAAEYLARCADNSMGMMVAFDVFEHIPPPELRELLTLIRAKLKPGGTLLFKVPNMASPAGMTYFYGDLSHTTPLNEQSVKQLAFGSGLELVGVYAEPFPWPRSVRAMLGILVWPIYRGLTAAALGAFGVPCRVLTPNLVCVLRRASELSETSQRAPNLTLVPAEDVGPHS